MSVPIVSSKHPVTLVGGGHLDRSVLNISKSHAPLIVAADGGADSVLEYGETPAAVIGDMDSVSDAAKALLSDRLHDTPDQNLTDFEKALAAIEAPLVLALGFLGGRLDHTMAALNVLARSGGRGLVLLTLEDAIFLAPEHLSLDLPRGSRVGLLPMETAQVSSSGLRWDLAERTLAPAGLVSSSNAAEGPVTLVSQGRLLVSLEAVQLPAAIAAVRAG